MRQTHNTGPALGQEIPLPLIARAKQRILLQLFYDKDKMTVKFTACYAVGVPAHCRNTVPEVNLTRSVPVASYKLALVSANVANPMPYPPTAGTSQILMPVTDAAVTSIATSQFPNGIHGDFLGPWSVKQQNERESLFGGNLVAKPQPPAPETSFDGKAFNIVIYGKPPIDP